MIGCGTGAKRFQQEIAVFVVRCRAEAIPHIGKYRTINLEAVSPSPQSLTQRCRGA
jgi:hypothetical protein